MELIVGVIVRDYPYRCDSGRFTGARRYGRSANRWQVGQYNG